MLSARQPSQPVLLSLLLAGLVVRVVCLPLPGTLDVSVWKIWAFSASTDDPARLYGTGGTPPERRRLGYDGLYTTVDYPILAVDVMAVVGRAYRAVQPTFPNGTGLDVAVKLPAVLADVGLGVLLWTFARRRALPGRFTLLTTYWVAPAVVLDAAALGYLDSLSALPATAALIAGAGDAWLLAGVLGAVGALTKAQGVVPMIALAWWAATTSRQAAGRLLAGAVGCAIVSLAPLALHGALPNFLESMRSLTRHDMVSGNATNVWWLYTWVFRACYDLDQGAWAAFTQPVARVLALSTVDELGHVSPKPFGLAMFFAAIVWAGWRFARVVRERPAATALGARGSRPSDWPLASALACLLVHSYYSLAVPVHENHLFLAVPLAALAALRLPAYTRVAHAVGTVQALNLFLFYGISEGIGWLPPRTVTVVDTTVVLAVISVSVFLWHLRVFARLTRTVEAV